MKLITLDIKDLYNDLPTQGITQAIKFWLHNRSHNIEENKQIVTLLTTIMEQNYFQYNDSFYKPHKGVAMGSPLSGTLTELYLQRIENEYIKQWLESKEIHYYKRYVDDNLILFNTHKIQEEQLLTLLVHAGRSIGLRCVCEECWRPMYRPISFNYMENNMTKKSDVNNRFLSST